MADSRSDFVTLARSGNPVQQTLIRDVLEQAGIPHVSRDHLGPMGGLIGDFSPMESTEFRVPRERLQEAKDLLCSSGIVCDVSKRLLSRTLDEVVKPLLGKRERDLERLLYLATINNKETMAALYEEARKLEGGLELLEDLFFEMARAGRGNLLLLARALAGRATAGFGERFLAEVTGADKETRTALLDVGSTFKTSFWLFESLAATLGDPDGEIREAAAEALFALEGGDHGYDPHGPEAEREAAIARFRKATGLG